jgi:hypothetical protein
VLKNLPKFQVRSASGSLDEALTANRFQPGLLIITAEERWKPDAIDNKQKHTAKNKYLIVFLF